MPGATEALPVDSRVGCGNLVSLRVLVVFPPNWRLVSECGMNLQTDTGSDRTGDGRIHRSQLWKGQYWSGEKKKNADESWQGRTQQNRTEQKESNAEQER